MADPLLADTHVLHWFLEGAREIGERSRRHLERAVLDGALWASAVSVFEIGDLVRVGRFRSFNLEGWVERATAAGILFLPFTPDEAVETTRLPGQPPQNPFDRMLIATSRVHGLTLATRDGEILDYGAAGHLETLEI